MSTTNDIPNLIRTAIRTNTAQDHEDELTSILERQQQVLNSQQQLTTTLLGVSLALSQDHPELRNALDDLAESAAAAGAINPELLENGELEIASETESCSCNCGDSEDDEPLESNDAEDEEPAAPVEPRPDPEEVLNAAAQAAANDDPEDEPPSGSFREYRMNQEQQDDDEPETNGTPATLSEWKRRNPEKAAEASEHVDLLESIRSRDPEDI